MRQYVYEQSCHPKSGAGPTLAACCVSAVRKDSSFRQMEPGNLMHGS